MKNCIKCGSHAFNLYAEGIDQGGFCDVHYWQGRAHRAEALAQPAQGLDEAAIRADEREACAKVCDAEGEYANPYAAKHAAAAIRARGNT
jgi:hypothetical protein